MAVNANAIKLSVFKFEHLIIDINHFYGLYDV